MAWRSRARVWASPSVKIVVQVECEGLSELGFTEFGVGFLLRMSRFALRSAEFSEVLSAKMCLRRAMQRTRMRPRLGEHEMRSTRRVESSELVGEVANLASR